MSLIRTCKTTRYFAASNEPFNDERLPFDARGVMGYLLSKPDNWEIRTADLVRAGPDGATKIYRILKDLERCGYLHRNQHQLPSGKFQWVHTIYESPSLNPHHDPTISRFSIDGSPMHGKPRDIVSTEKESTERTAAAVAPAEEKKIRKKKKNRPRDLFIDAITEELQIGATQAVAIKATLTGTNKQRPQWNLPDPFPQGAEGAKQFRAFLSWYRRENPDLDPPLSEPKILKWVLRGRKAANPQINEPLDGARKVSFGETFIFRRGGRGWVPEQFA